MFKPSFPLALAGICACFAILPWKNDRLALNQGEVLQHILNQKLAPYDHFDNMRSYPEMVPDQRGIDQAIGVAHQMRFQSHRSNGFDQLWRIEGPGNIGARINSIAVSAGGEDTIYIGYAKGGVFRTYDGGSNWTSIFENQPNLSIGDVAINPLNDAVIYAGTGDRNIGGSFTTGTGIYRSNDHGDTWQHMGLSDQYIISEIAINPIDTAIVYAACMGLPSLPDNNRGLYKSPDGGNTWTQVLFVGDSAGITDIVMHPTNPDILYATGWNRTRTNQVSVIAGNEGRIWKTTDGGATWTMLTNGLPTGAQGRVGITMFTPDPDTLYALFVGVDAELEGIYRTYDGGSNWTVVPTVANGVSTNAMGGFGWYFSGIYVNPYDYEDVFFDGIQLWRSQNGGNTWDEADPPWWTYEVHADKHDLHFLGPNDFLLATDGGLYRSVNSGANWFKIESNKTNEFYRVAHTHLDGANYYGGMQDNGTTGGNASLSTWPRIYGGDGFQVRFNDSNSDIFYVETQNGNIVYTDDGGNSFSSSQFPDQNDRTNWDTPYFLSVHDQTVLFAASHTVWRQGFAPYGGWTEISGDLTDGNIFGSSFHTISGIDQSPSDADRLYACTTDGNVWRTVNGGNVWDSIHTGLPNRYVTSVKASPTDEDHLFVTHSGYKYNDFFAHVHKSENNGNTWIDISGDLPPVAVNDIIIYPGYQDSVLFIGTDAGVYGTIDGGVDWTRVGTNMPVIAVLDLTLDTVNNRLVAATFGRSIMTYPLDSLLPSVPGDTSDTGSIVLAFTVSDMSCQTTANGAVSLAITGGTPPFTYNWSNGASSSSITSLAAGIYTVTVTDALSESITGQVQVNHVPIHPDPVVGPINGPMQANSWATFIYDVPGTSGSVFSWIVTGGTIISTAANAAEIQWFAGPLASIEVSETDINGCQASIVVPVSLEFVGTEDLDSKDVQVFPNPASDVVSIVLPESMVESTIQLWDSKGSLIQSEKHSNGTVMMSVADLPEGTYHLLITSTGRKIQRQLMIAR